MIPSRRITLTLGILGLLVIVASQSVYLMTVDMRDTHSLLDKMPYDQPVPSGTVMTWHHDCSNLTAFDGIGDNSWPHNDDVTVTFGTIDCSGTYFYSDDVGTGSGHHGPLLYHTLEKPFSLVKFAKLQGEIEIDGTSADRRAWIRIGLHDPYNTTILTLQIADPWIGVSAAYAQLVYRFANGTVVETSQTYPEYTNPEPCRETFAVVYNVSGLFTSFPGVTNSCLLSAQQIESTRVVKYISIQFNGYDDGVLCEVMRIHDIVLNYDESLGTEEIAKSWYHDCSNTTGFTNLTDNTWALDEGPNEHNVVSGIVESSGTFIYCSDYGTGNEWFGPLYTYELSDSVPISAFDELIVAMEVGCTTDGELVRIDVILNDENHAPIMGISVHDGWAGDDAILPEAYWMFSNGSFIRINQGYANSVQTSYSEHLRIYENATGFFSELPQIGTYKLVGIDQINSSRVVRYVSIHAMRWESDPVCPIARFHNITLCWHEIGVNVPPFIDNPEDVIYYQGAVGNFITWHPSDINPASYEILQEETIITTGPWNSSSEVIAVSVDGLATGTYNYTLIVYDTGGLNSSDTVIVIVLDLDIPVIDHAENITLAEGTVGHNISWTIYDQNPANYEVFKDGWSVQWGIWNSSGEVVAISLDGLELGLYNYTIAVFDHDSNIALDTAFVEIYDGTPPIIDSPADIYYVFGDTGHSILWSPIDTHPDEFEISRNGTLVAGGVWNGSSIVISVDGLQLGLYEYMLVVWDIGGNVDADIVYVNVSVSITTTTSLPTNTTTQTGIPDIILIISVGVGGTIIIVIIVIVMTSKRGPHGR